MKILCVGRSLLDAVVKPVKRFPPRYGAQTVESVSLKLGGGGTITANVLSRLGHEVALLSHAGDGPAADFLSRLLQDGGVDTSNVLRDKKHMTLVNVIGVDSVGNARYLMSPDDEVPYSREELDTAINTTTFDAIHISTFNQFMEEDGEPLKSWLETVREKNPSVIIIADTSKLAYCSARAITIAHLIDYFTGNQVELRRIAEHIAIDDHALSHLPTDCTQITELIMSKGVTESVIVKLGSSGAAYRNEGKMRHSPAFVVNPISDENGAGDVFCAALLHSLLESCPLDDAVERGNALAITHLRSGIDFSSSSPLNFEQLVSEAKMLPRSRYMTSDMAWWTFEQSTPGFGERFDVTRRLSDITLRKWLDAIVRSANLTRDSRVLDAGCGTGRFAIPLQHRLGCAITGVDCSEDVLARARKKSSSVEWIPADLTQLDSAIGDRIGTYDCVWMSSVVSQVGDDITAVLTNSHQQLKRGGTLLIRFASRELIKQIDWFNYFTKARQEAFARYPELASTIRYVTHSGFHVRVVDLFDDHEYMPVAEFRTRIKKGGFSWRHLYSDSEIEECLAVLEDHNEGQQFCYHHPTYLIVATKT